MIRRFRESDLPEMLDVWSRSARDAYHFLPHDFFDAERIEIEQAIFAAETWVYETDGRVAGFIALIGEREVGGFFVDPRSQSRGIGRALMDHVRALRGRVELDVFEANANGRRFYDRYGFRQIGSHVHESTGQIELRLALPE